MAYWRLTLLSCRASLDTSVLSQLKTKKKTLLISICLAIKFHNLQHTCWWYSFSILNEWRHKILNEWMNSLQNGLCIGLTVNPFSTKEEDSLCKSDAIFCECIFSRKLENQSWVFPTTSPSNNCMNKWLGEPVLVFQLPGRGILRNFVNILDINNFKNQCIETLI